MTICDDSATHWSRRVTEVTLSALPEDGRLRLPIIGGADAGNFFVIRESVNERSVIYWSGRLSKGNIILEIQGHQISGYTLHDVNIVLDHLSRNGNPLLFKILPSGALPLDLRTFLSSRFRHGSADYQLQQNVRDNLYLRTVPCTTRPPRPDEVEGRDYLFISIDVYLTMERSGKLLESGVYEGNHYGTPRPSGNATGLMFDGKGQLVNGAFDNSSTTSTSNDAPKRETKASLVSSFMPKERSLSESATETRPMMESTHSSPGQIRRHIVQQEPNPHLTPTAMSAMAAQFANKPTEGNQVTRPLKRTPPPPPERKIFQRSLSSGTELACDSTPVLFQVPLRSPRRYTGRPLSGPIMHQTSAPPSPSIRSENLPYGWERVEDADFGVFYIDHINKTTQYEKPQTNDAHNRKRMESAMDQRGMLINGIDTGEPLYPPVFTLNPKELKGRSLRTTLVKSPRGLGFTIVGHGGGANSVPSAENGSEQTKTEPSLLQIRSITAGGPAAVDGMLRSGDVLVFVDAICVLGHSHSDVVKVFQSIAVGDTVTLTINRGYRLPDMDSDTQVITTSAVGPEISGDFIPSDGITVEFVRVHLLKASTGFGFTIADSPQGQRIKQIVDQSRCRLLQEGDILVEVDDQRVKEMLHLDVVQLLKDCSVGQVTRLLLQRHRLAPGPRPRPVSTFVTDPNHSPNEKSNPFSNSNGQANGKLMTKADSSKPVSAVSSPPTAATIVRTSQCPVSLPRSTSEPAPIQPTIRLLPATVVSECMGRPKPGVVNRGPSLTIKPSKSFDNSSNGVVKRLPSTGNLSAVSRRICSGSSYQLFSTLRRRSRTPDRLRPSSLHNDEGKATKAEPEDDTTEEEAGVEGKEMKIFLTRGAAGFGFRLVGGAEEGTPITVGSIVNGGAAHEDGRIHCGDEILAIDSCSVLGASHHKAVQMMEGRGRIMLTLRRPPPRSRRRRSSLPPPAVRDRSLSRNEPIEVVLSRGSVDKDDPGFGFVLTSIPNPRGENHGMIEVVDFVQPNSPADASGRIHVGDQLLYVNGIDVTNIQHRDVLAFIKSCGKDVALRLLPYGQSVRFNINNNTINTPDKEHSGTISRGHVSRINSAPNPARMNSTGTHDSADGLLSPRDIDVFLKRGPRGFGFSIRGGYEFNCMPLYILRIAEGGAADIDRRMRVGDRIMSINGRSTDGMTNADAVILIQAQRTSIRLRLRREHGSEAS